MVSLTRNIYPKYNQQSNSKNNNNIELNQRISQTRNSIEKAHIQTIQYKNPIIQAIKQQLFAQRSKGRDSKFKCKYHLNEH